MSSSQSWNEGEPEDLDLDGMNDDDESGDLQDSDDIAVDGEGAMSNSKMDPPHTKSIQESIDRLDELLMDADDEDKIRAGMGVRLALGMAQELKRGIPLGSETGDMVMGWVMKYGQEKVDEAVDIARQFLIKPEEMRKALGQRLGFGNPD